MIARLKVPVCLVAVVLLSLSTEWASAGETPRVLKDLEFAEVDGHSLKLDLHLSATPRGSKLLVWIHGGGWRSGNKERCFVTWLNEHNFTVASISYRLSGQAKFPAQIHDCKAAIRWLRANAEKYGYSTTKIAVGGSSAGGHLAALVGTSGDVKALEGTVGGNLEHSSRVDAVVDFYGPVDFLLRSRTQPQRTNPKTAPVNMLLGGPVPEKMELAKQASPVTHVSDDDPPFLVFHGTKDAKVLLDQAERMKDVYTNAHLPIDLHILPDSGHGGREFYTGKSAELIVQFLKEHLN